MTMTKDRFVMLGEICDRFESMAGMDAERFGSRLSRVMDLESAIDAGVLCGVELLTADDQTFAHDVAGIHRHTDRSSYPATLTGCFLPRCHPKP